MKPPIIILHGWGLSGARFTPLVNELKKRGYAVYAPDFPGFGETDAPKSPLHLSDYADFLYDYIKKNHLIKPILIGHSFGGRVSLKFEKMYPKNARALILSGTPGFTPIGRKKLLLFVVIAKIGGAFWSLPPFYFLKESVRRLYYYLVGAKEFSRAEGSMRDTFKNVVKEDLRDPMLSVHCPCLLIWGEEDVIVPINIANRMASIIPGAKLSIIKNADHGLPFKQPIIFVKEVEKFIGSL